MMILEMGLFKKRNRNKEIRLHMKIRQSKASELSKEESNLSKGLP